MKKQIKILPIVLLIIWIISPISAQLTKTSYNYLIWGSGGVSKLINDAPYRKIYGNLGTTFGAGYEMYIKKIFIQSGIEYSYLSSSMRLKDTSFVKPMIDTESILFNGNFKFQNTSDLQQITNIGIPILFGYETLNRNFFAIGGKLNFNLIENSKATSIVTSTATYNNIIGDNNDGTLSNMPNHQLYTNKRLVKSTLKLGTIYSGTVEIGHTFENQSQIYLEKKNTPNFRVSIFCDYGITPVLKKEESIFVDISKTEEYIPAIKGYILNDINSSYLDIFYVGIKLTAVFNVTKYNCKCPKVN